MVLFIFSTYFCKIAVIKLLLETKTNTQLGFCFFSATLLLSSAYGNFRITAFEIISCCVALGKIEHIIKQNHYRCSWNQVQSILKVAIHIGPKRIKNFQDKNLPLDPLLVRLQAHRTIQLQYIQLIMSSMSAWYNSINKQIFQMLFKEKLYHLHFKSSFCLIIFKTFSHLKTFS